LVCSATSREGFARNASCETPAWFPLRVNRRSGTVVWIALAAAELNGGGERFDVGLRIVDKKSAGDRT
jgi:hypothetical protein